MKSYVIFMIHILMNGISKNEGKSAHPIIFEWADEIKYIFSQSHHQAIAGNVHKHFHEYCDIESLNLHTTL